MQHDPLFIIGVLFDTSLKALHELVRYFGR